MILFHGDKARQIKVWDQKQDYLLAAMILEKGFGKWLEMLQSKDWSKWASTCHFLGMPQEKNNISYNEYLKRILSVDEEW